jgi:hypothetical protein
MFSLSPFPSLLSAMPLLLPIPILITIYLLRLLHAQHRSVVHLLPGPPSPGFLMGHLKEIYDMENTDLLERWEGVYGCRLVYKSFFGRNRLVPLFPPSLFPLLPIPSAG